jgi:hypothetical protein
MEIYERPGWSHPSPLVNPADTPVEEIVIVEEVPEEETPIEEIIE